MKPFVSGFSLCDNCCAIKRKATEYGIWSGVFGVFGLQQFSLLRRAPFLSFGKLLRNDVGQVGSKGWGGERET